MAAGTARGKHSVVAPPEPVEGRVEASVRKPRRRPATADARGPAETVAASGVGLVLLDASLKVLYANGEAIRILAYPAAPPTRHARDPHMTKKIRAQLESSRPSPAQPSLTELSSGRRRYLCRAFALGPGSSSLFTTASFQPSIAALIERSKRALAELAKVGDQFHLTPREREAMALLLHGLTSKQIAARMNVSPNTVKAFLRMIMLRMGVSTRSAIVGKILASAF